MRRLKMTERVVRVLRSSWFVSGIVLVSTVGCELPDNYYATLTDTAGVTFVGTIVGAIATAVSNLIIGG
jgi:hypothetical protein